MAALQGVGSYNCNLTVVLIVDEELTGHALDSSDPGKVVTF